MSQKSDSISRHLPAAFASLVGRFWLVTFTQFSWATDIELFFYPVVSAENEIHESLNTVNIETGTYELNDGVPALDTGHNRIRLNFSPNFTFDLQIESYSLLADNFRFRLATDQGVIDGPEMLARTYRGRSTDDPESQVRLTIGPNYFSGFIKTGSNEQFFIESVAPANKTAESETRVRIFNISSLNKSGIQLVNDIGLAENWYLDFPGIGLSSGATYTADIIYEAEIALVADYYAFTKTNSTDQLAYELLNILNITDAYYNQLNITYRLVELFIFTYPEAEPWPDSNDAGELLDAFDSWVGDGGLLNWHDLATFWSGRSIGYSYGWLNSIGTFRRHHLVEFWNMGYTRWLGNFQAHEAGHNWGATHMEDDPRWIMSSHIYDGVINWHSATVAAFPGFINTALDYLDPADSVSAPAFLSYQPQIINDDNQDGGVDPGENFELQLPVVNIGDDTSNSVVVYLNLTGANSLFLTVHEANDTVGLLDPMVTTYANHNLSVAADIPMSSQIGLEYLISDGTVSATASYQLEIGQIPEYGYLVAGVIDNGNSNGKFDPGENILLLIDIKNQGTVNGQNINVVVQPQGANAIYIQNVDSPQIIGSLEADASTQQEITFEISEDFPASEEVELMITVSDSFSVNQRLRSFVVGLPSQHHFWEDFEYFGYDPLGAGWTQILTNGLPAISTWDSVEVHDEDNSNWISGPYAGRRALFSAENWIGSGSGEVRIITPLIDLRDAIAPNLHFKEIRGWDNYWPNTKPDHQIKIESSSSPTGPWSTIASISFNEDDFMNWQTVNEIDLSAHVGERIYLSFYTDTHHYYWRIDNVAVTDSTDEDLTPQDFRLSQNYPNPFNSGTTIEYSLTQPAEVNLAIYDLTGRLINTLVDYDQPAGRFTVHWNGIGKRGTPVSAGVYFCRLQTADHNRTIKMLLLK